MVLAILMVAAGSGYPAAAPATNLTLTGTGTEVTPVAAIDGDTVWQVGFEFSASVDCVALGGLGASVDPAVPAAFDEHGLELHLSDVVYTPPEGLAPEPLSQKVSFKTYTFGPRTVFGEAE